ncbi:hypothetical protein R1sor_025283 [Riccia sorocarpa]|uniref:Uncharacterized protein n=1 Tax=Riccia sorocarpa TaxID=122646 RepID=A0ABD3GB98_9MARC
MSGYERNYDFASLIDCASGLNRLASMEYGPENLHLGKTHSKQQTIWEKLHPLLSGEASLTSLTSVVYELMMRPIYQVKEKQNFKYGLQGGVDREDLQWIDLDSVITMVSLKVKHNVRTVWSLDANDRLLVDEFLQSL